MLQAGSDGDDTWLHQRVRHTHDLWHVVCGCPPTAAGEAAMNRFLTDVKPLAGRWHTHP
jgi:ubiquinone biosynthesis protein Coq4